MKRKMTIFGVGIKIALFTILYFFISVIFNNIFKPSFNISLYNSNSLYYSGIILIFIGCLWIFGCTRKLRKSFKAEYLMKDGLYSIFRNPMYAAYLLFIIPGIGLLFNSWIVLSTVIIFYIFFAIFIREEYRYLEEKFGKEYLDYKKKVLIKFL
jgi:protein-S-isoprenylcysteine O-methyltransferase Ste14